MGKTPDGVEELFVNTVTGERFYYLPHDKPASAPFPHLPAGWSKLVSKGTGATYFLHTDGASQFEMPSEPAEEADMTYDKSDTSTSTSTDADAATGGDDDDDDGDGELAEITGEEWEMEYEKWKAEGKEGRPPMNPDTELLKPNFPKTPTLPLGDQRELADAGGAAVSELLQQKKRFEVQQAEQQAAVEKQLRAMAAVGAEMEAEAKIDRRREFLAGELQVGELASRRPAAAITEAELARLHARLE
jgi:hypothetical protein